MTAFRNNFYFLVLVLCLLQDVNGQTFDTLRVATYNILNYPGNNSASRNPEFRKILRVIDPDILIVQEMQSSSGVNEFLNQVLNFGQAGTYSAVAFQDGPDTDNALYYKSARVSFQGQIILTTALRDINGYIVRPIGVASDSLDFRLYSAHLKASQGFESDRLAEATILRNHLNALGPGHYIFGGDFNLYSSNEPAYERLLENQSDNDGRLYDVIASPGTWHDDVDFAAVHTQSPRLTDIGDGGSSGGLDDRFDFLLPTYAFQSLPGWQVVAGSYTEFGNDGAHFGQSVNNGTNFAVPDSIADALHVSSDHLPVYMDIIRQVTASPSITLLNPNGGQSFGEGDSVSITWTTLNYNGTISVSLSRTGPGGVFESLVSATSNDGQFSWIANGSPTTQARVKVVLDALPATNDVSDASFTIADRDISIFTPSNSDSVSIGSILDIQWTAINVPGNVRIELQRIPSIGSWELITSSSPNTGFYGWATTGPVTDSAQVRVLVASAPTVGDTSGMFKIKDSSINFPPAISHNPVCDTEPGIVTFFCEVEDAGGYSPPYLVWTSNGFSTKDSLQLNTVALDRFSVSSSFLSDYYQYYIFVADFGGLSARSDTFEFAVQQSCPVSISYDDGTAETYQWSEDVGMTWAVRFSPPLTPFVLCAAEYAVSVRKPDSSHGQIDVFVLDANGIDNSPGDTLGIFSSGTMPNLPSGGAGSSPSWGKCVLKESNGQPISINGDFYLAMTQSRTAFALDTSNGVVGRSIVWDVCDSAWYPEDNTHENSRQGNRMLRATGFALVPPVVVISSQGEDVVLRWASTSAPLYEVYRALTPEGPFELHVAATPDTVWSDVGVIPNHPRAFYQVRSSLP